MASGVVDIWVSSTSFQKIDIGWSQQPPTEIVLISVKNFWQSIPQKGTSIVTRHRIHKKNFCLVNWPMKSTLVSNLFLTYLSLFWTYSSYRRTGYESAVPFCLKLGIIIQRMSHFVIKNLIGNAAYFTYLFNTQLCCKIYNYLQYYYLSSRYTATIYWWTAWWPNSFNFLGW